MPIAQPRFCKTRSIRIKTQSGSGADETADGGYIV